METGQPEFFESPPCGVPKHSEIRMTTVSVALQNVLFVVIRITCEPTKSLSSGGSGKAQWRGIHRQPETDNPSFRRFESLCLSPTASYRRNVRGL